MGALNPITTVLSAVGTLGSVLGAGNNAYNTKQQYQQAQATYNANEQSIQADHDLQQQQNELDAANQAQNRRDALRRAMSKQQAAFGGQGIDTTDGSGEAVLLGLFNQSAEEKAYQDRLNQLKSSALEQDTADKRRRNLLNLQGAYTSTRSSAVQTADNLGKLGGTLQSFDNSGDQ
jgi:hypothetical protein